MDLDYTPVPDETGAPAGVLVFVTETTERVLAERRAAEEAARQRRMLQQMPGFAAVLSGPDHRFEYVNDAYVEISGGDRGFVGRTVREVFPELADQGIFELLDGVYTRGERFTAPALPISLAREDGQRIIDLLYEPIRDEDGAVTGIFVGGYDVTIANRTASALEESEIRYRTVFDAATTGLCIVKMKFDEKLTPIDYMIVDGNAAFEKLTGLINANGKWVSEIAPGLERHWFELYGRVALTGEPARFEQPAEIFGRWYDVQALRLGDPGDLTVAILFEDMTDRRAADMRQRALIDLNDALRDLREIDEIALASARILNKAVGGNRAVFATVAADQETIITDRDWSAEGVASLAGTLNLRNYGTFIDDLRRGDIVVVTDVASDARTRDFTAAHAERHVASFAIVPVIEHDQLVAIMSVSSAAPREWKSEEVEFLQEVAARTRITTERARSAVARRESEARYEALFTAMDEGFCIIEFIDGPEGPLSDYVHVEANAAYAQNAGIPNVVGQKVRQMVGREAQEWVDLYKRVLDTGKSIRFEKELEATGRWLELSAFRIEPRSRNQVAVLFNDLTERKRAERDLLELNATLERRVGEAVTERMQIEEALRQSQKMEAVGQLTGGIAHDFNNLLGGISGSLELLEKRIAAGRLEGVQRYITSAQEASRRAASLTQRLLAFSRRQTLDPKPLDANKLIAGMEDLVRRTVGPTIDVEVVGAGGLWPTKADASQLENALLNLCINARDAMAPKGGKLTIETANKWLDDRAARDRELPPGQYISICVTDNGAGMEPDVIARAFDPFFTTKPIGQGTGLGLSMVYGFVRQSNGQVRIYSEVGTGTTMCLYLPRHMGNVEDAEQQPEDQQVERGAGETVLVIDDEAILRMLALDVLEENGYNALEAHDGPSGLKILQSDARIDLLITDVGLPGGMNGRQVADAARELRPNLKVLFITGYAENAIINHGHLEPGMEVLTKPFPVATLGQRIRDMIER
ncbi:MAG: hybrid sensor histidine kinase/response regulator [Alphaproteobacteria bacterium]|nr:MAG: hybrid sensor histidine kinase/response regulator [Alphaproteobacteria bacterium]